MPAPLNHLAIALTATVAFGSQHIQSPDAAWKTIHTSHYRIHYPAAGGFEAFAKEVAARIEGMHSLMQPWIGHAFSGPTDVLIMDPIANANGMTFPDQHRAHIILWRTSPDSEWEIAHGRDWVEELVPHELVHLHHLTLPDRKPGFFRRFFWGPGISAVNMKCPAWVSEGYATMLEGRLTGMGRPHGAYRAQVLRLMAREGRLPIYKDLNKDYGRYLVSSAFLAWLEQHGPAGEKSLPELWLRLSSSRYPTFDEGFQATFGQSPETAYNRFCAELAHDALEVERRVTLAGLREGELWGFVPHLVQDLSLSPNGTRLLGRVLDPKEGGLFLWDVKAPLADAASKAKRAKKDAELPPEIPEQFPARQVSMRLSTVDGQVPGRPRWSTEGIRYRVRRSDKEGVLHLVERIWNPGGASTLEPSIEPIYPAWEGTQWMVTVEGKRWPLPFETMGPLSWDKARKRLYATRVVQGIISIVRLDFDPALDHPFGAEMVLTRTASAALYPAPTPDGKALYFMVPKAKGAEIRRLDLEKVSGTLTAWIEDPTPFVPGTVRPPADEASLIPAPEEPPAAQDYRVAESHHLSARFGGVIDPSGKATQIGIGGRDILPRLDWEVLGSFGDPGTHGEGPQGALAGVSWRGWAWAPHLQLFSEDDRPSQQRFVPVQGWDQERRGFELGVDRAWLNLGEGLKVQGALAAERIETLAGGSPVSRRIVWTKARQNADWELNGWSCAVGYEAEGAAGHTASQNWNLGTALVSFGGGYRWTAVNLIGEAGRLGGSPTSLDQFQLGGQDHGILPSSLSVNAVFQPALPTHLAAGDRFERWRAETAFGL